MCTSTCPCPTSAKEIWDDVPEERLNNASRAPSTYSGSDYTALVFQDSDTYNTYSDCYNQSLKDKTDS
jgi:hypothetical protein